MTVDPLPVAPAAHYLMGGVRTNLWGETSVPGLYACGEVACTGVHGANRLASNSLLEGLVFGARIVERTIRPDTQYAADNDANELRIVDVASPQCVETQIQKPDLEALQALMWSHAGLIRDEAGLRAVQTQLELWQSAMSEPRTAAEHELVNMVLIGRLMATAALERCESRGGHWRRDFPDPDPLWQKHIVFEPGCSSGSVSDEAQFAHRSCSKTEVRPLSATSTAIAAAAVTKEVR